tara:strand:+ start:566 stop:769 length:204 start_codon:yes stop_codon:yes gene_type:complete
MSNVKKGNQFEEKSLEIIENIKENGLFGIKDFIEITPAPQSLPTLTVHKNLRSTKRLKKKRSIRFSF